LPVELYGDYIDFTNTEKYGAANIAEVNSFNGSIYGVSPITWIYKQPRSIGLTVFNMDLVSTYGKANPREYLEKNEWTWETFEHVVDDYYVKELQRPIFVNGKLVYNIPTLAESRKYCDEEFKSLTDRITDVESPHTYYVDLSEKERELKEYLLFEATKTAAETAIENNGYAKRVGAKK
jgi:hypothetical protein